jgi:polyprenyldihydroxybenzoate methyltransferase/3-demethylubiquinol 3-O-methyltransferase
MNPLRLQFLSSCLSKHGDATKNMKYLDVGCGGGILAESLARLKGTESVIGVDPTPEVLKIARGHMRQDPALQGRLRYVGATIDTLEKVLAEEEGRELKDGWEGRRRMFDVVSYMATKYHGNINNDMGRLQLWR